MDFPRIPKIFGSDFWELTETPLSQDMEITFVDDSISILEKEWKQWKQNGYEGLIPTKRMKYHTILCHYENRRYVRLVDISFPFEIEDAEMTVPGETPWFCLDLVPLIRERNFEEASKQKFMLCPECYEHEFEHIQQDDDWFQDICTNCGIAWHAINYSWANSLVGEWLNDYGKFLSKRTKSV